MKPTQAEIENARTLAVWADKHADKACEVAAQAAAELDRLREVARK